jgi:PmbA protein
LERARQLGATQAEVFEVETVSTPVAFENNKLKSALTAETTGVAIRLIKGDRLGFATSSRPADKTVVDMAVRSAEFGPEADYDFAARAPVRADLSIHDPAVAGWPQEKMLEAGEGLVESLRGVEDGVMATVLVDRDTQYVRVTNSLGQEVWAESTSAACTGLVEMTRADNMILVWHFTGSRRLDLDFAAVADRIGWLYRHARRNVSMRGGVYPVVFAPAAASHLMNPLSSCLDGKAVAKGESPWKDKIGEAVFSEAFTLYDDPTIPWGLRSTPFDDEGVPTIRRAVIDRGVIRGFLLDLRSGKALGQAGTGNGYRSTLQAMPAPRASSLVLEPGPTPLAELVAGIKEGLYVDDLMGAWAGNPYTGQVSGNIQTGFRIENGEITGRVKDCMLSVNVFEGFRDHLLALSLETSAAMGGQILPHVLLGRVGVSAKGSVP